MQFTRRTLLTSIISLCATHPSEAAVVKDNERPLVGAIRWDAWYAPGSGPTSAVESTLEPPQYRWRFPFFAESKTDAPNVMRLPKGSQAEIDLEIRQAIYAGLDYWAFVSYELNDPMSSAFNLYLSSQVDHRIRFCFFTELARFGSSQKPAKLINEHIELMKDLRYVRVQGGRPLYYLGFIDKQTVMSHWGGIEGVRQAISQFRKSATEATGKDPYIAICGPLSEFREWSSAGGDAISAYSLGDPRAVGEFSALETITEQRWTSLASAGLPVIPTAMAGFDRRPRIEHPVPWEPYQKPGAGIQNHYEQPSQEELARHVRNAIHFAIQQSAPAILIYAWNENDEGGWLVPTVPCKAERLSTLHQLLTPPDHSHNPGCAMRSGSGHF